MSEKNQIVTFDFHGDALEVVQDERGVWVALKRVCESIGVDFSGQRRKLDGKPWATVDFKSTVGNDGKSREMLAIHLDSLPMWLATIEPSKVAAEVRPTLELYQREAARVLRDHFIGKPKAAQPSRDAKEARLLEQHRMRVLKRFTSLLRKSGHDQHADEVELRHTARVLGEDARPFLRQLPTEKYSSSEDIGNERNISASTVGRFAKALGLQTAAAIESGKTRKVSNHVPDNPLRQVTTFLYREPDVANLIREKLEVWIQLRDTGSKTTIAEVCAMREAS